MAPPPCTATSRPWYVLLSPQWRGHAPPRVHAVGAQWHAVSPRACAAVGEQPACVYVCSMCPPSAVYLCLSCICPSHPLMVVYILPLSFRSHIRQQDKARRQQDKPIRPWHPLTSPGLLDETANHEDTRKTKRHKTRHSQK
jgi:hypothetical protein